MESLQEDRNVLNKGVLFYCDENKMQKNLLARNNPSLKLFNFSTGTWYTGQPAILVQNHTGVTNLMGFIVYCLTKNGCLKG